MRRVERLEFREFEWNEEKRLRTLKDRCIDFRAAANALLEPHLEQRSDKNGEIRTLAICAFTMQIIAIVYTVRGDVCRII